VKTSADAPRGLGRPRYARTSFFFPRSIIPVLFRRSECRCTVTVTSKRAIQIPRLTMPRLLVTGRGGGGGGEGGRTRRTPPLIPEPCSSLFGRSSSSSSFLVHSFSRVTLFILGNVSPPITRPLHDACL